MTRFTRSAAPLLLAMAALALAACAAPSPEPSATAAAGQTAAPCEVTVVVDFGPLDQPSIEGCVAAGPALDVLDEAGLSTEGTADYGDAVVCRVNNQPAPDEEVVIDGQAPFIETCDTFSSVAYWALWVKSAPDAEWAYAEEGVATLELADGQSVGLVYTAGTDSIPPQD